MRCIPSGFLKSLSQRRKSVTETRRTLPQNAKCPTPNVHGSPGRIWSHAELPTPALGVHAKPASSPPSSLLLRRHLFADRSPRCTPSQFERLVGSFGPSHEPANTAGSRRVFPPVSSNPWTRSPRSAAEVLPSSIPHPGLVVFWD